MDIDLSEYLRRKQWGFDLVEELRIRDLRTLGHEDWLKSLRRVQSTVREPRGYLFEAALTVQGGVLAAGFDFCFIGGVALQRWGEVRHTDDVDLTIWCGWGDELSLADRLSKFLTPEVEDVKRVAQVGRMFVGRTPDGTKVDISFGALPYEERMLERAVSVDFGVAEPLRCCSAEDLAILKTVAGRGQDWVDIRRIIHRSGARMDWDLVREELRPLLNAAYDEEALPRLEELLKKEME